MPTATTTVAIGCQGGGSHTAFTAGVLRTLLTELPEDHEIVALSGTSGGALCATTAWYGLLADGPEGAADRLSALWKDVAADSVFECWANQATVWTEHLRSMGVPMPSPSPYHVPATDVVQDHLQDVIEAQVDFDRIPDLVEESTPRLVLGAVDVTSGSFEVFEDPGITPTHVLASTAVPTLFPAVRLDGRSYWDGIFSQNPPIRDFLTTQDTAEAKPDEIWIVQINPECNDSAPTRSADIVDRRNELAGNLSLEQEIRFIEQVNEWRTEDVLPADRYKQVAVERIRLDRELSYASKLDTRPSFVEELVAEGERTAEAFLAERVTASDPKSDEADEATD